MGKGKNIVKNKINSCSQRKREKKKTEFLHEGVIFNILCCVSVECLYNIMRYVCVSWARIIRDPLFIENQLRESNPGIFIQSTKPPFNARFLELTQGEEFRVVGLHPQFPGVFSSSCDGAILFCDPLNEDSFYIANPVTMQAAAIPRLKMCPPSSPYSCGIARVPFTQEYKLVHTYQDATHACHWYILTLGIDRSWRKIDSTYEGELIYGFPFGCGKCPPLYLAPISIGGVLYWAGTRGYYMERVTYMFAMDVKDECICKISLPEPGEGFRHFKCCSMGNSLSLFTRKVHAKFEVYILEDLKRGKWVKFQKINLEVEGVGLCNRSFPVPWCWLNNGEVLIIKVSMRNDRYKTSMFFCTHSLKKRETKLIDVSIDSKEITSVHSNSLVTWKTL